MAPERRGPGNTRKGTGPQAKARGPVLLQTKSKDAMRKTTVTYTFRDNATVPMIRLRGQWLKDAGFDEGTILRVAVSEGRLTLTVADARAPS